MRASDAQIRPQSLQTPIVIGRCSYQSRLLKVIVGWRDTHVKIIRARVEDLRVFPGAGQSSRVLPVACFRGDRLAPGPIREPGTECADDSAFGP